MPQSFPRCNRINILCFYHLVFIVRMYVAFLRHQKTGAQLHPHGAQHQSGGNTSPVPNAPGSHHRNADRIYHLRYQRHGRKLPNMTSAFTPLGNDCRSSGALNHFSNPRRGNNRNNLDTSFIPCRHKSGRIACTRGHNRDFFFRHNPGNLLSKRTHQHNVDTKRLVRIRFGFSDLIPHIICRCIARGNDSKSSGIGYGSGKSGICNPCHAALKNRIVYSYQFTKPRCYHCITPYCVFSKIVMRSLID